MFSFEFCEIFLTEHLRWLLLSIGNTLAIAVILDLNPSLHEKCQNTEFFLVRITEILLISPYSALMRENTDQKKLRIWTLSTQWMFSFFISISILFSVLLLLCVSTRTSVFLLKNIICFQKIVDKKTDEWYIG